MTPQSALSMPRSVFDAFYKIGRVMVDFGFGSLVEKFEVYFGKRLTKVLIGVMGFSAILILISAVFSNVIAPLVGYIFDISEKTGKEILFFRRALNVTGIIISVILVSALSISLWEARKIIRTLRDLMDVDFDVKISRSTKFTFFIIGIRYAIHIYDNKTPDPLGMVKEEDGKLAIQSAEKLYNDLISAKAKE